MNALVEDIVEEVRGAWRFRWWGLLAAWIVGVVGWFIVMLLPLAAINRRRFDW